MTTDYINAIDKLRNLEEVYAAYALTTNMPFVSCDKETQKDQVFIFSTHEEVQEFTEQYKDQRILFKSIRIQREKLPEFYADLHSMGIDEIVFRTDGVNYKLELDKTIKIPDFSELPENKRPVMNPELQLSTIYFFQKVRRQGVEHNNEELEYLAKEMYANLAVSRFLMPVKVVPTEGGKGTLNIPYISDKNGNEYQPIFSDHTQYLKHAKKNNSGESFRVLVVGIAELLKYMLPDGQGYMLNPDGYCHVLNKQQLEFILKHFCN